MAGITFKESITIEISHQSKHPPIRITFHTGFDDFPLMGFEITRFQGLH